jgi:putative alpha-1,2-mannosidase
VRALFYALTRSESMTTLPRGDVPHWVRCGGPGEPWGMTSVAPPHMWSHAACWSWASFSPWSWMHSSEPWSTACSLGTVAYPWSGPSTARQS